MVIVDDHLTLLTLAGALPATEFDDDIATTSLWYLRLVSAATAPHTEVHGPGRLGRILRSLPEPADALERILHPPQTTLQVLHPMVFAMDMARMQRERRLNLLGAETLGAAAHHGASVLVAAPNSGGRIERAASAEGIPYAVRASLTCGRRRTTSANSARLAEIATKRTRGLVSTDGVSKPERVDDGTRATRNYVGVRPTRNEEVP